MYLLVIKQLVTMLFIMAAGFIFAKIFKVEDKEEKFLSKMLLYLINPLMIVNSFNIEFNSAKLKQLLFVVAVALLAHGVMILVGILTTLSKKEELKDFNQLDRLAAVFTNCGFVGIPLIRGVFGNEGVFYLMGYLIVFNILLWTYGYYQMCGSVNIKKILLNPNIIAIAVGMIIFCSPFTLPEFIAKPLAMIGDLNTAVSMILLGILLAEFKKEESKMFAFRIIRICFIRLVVCGLVNICILYVIYKLFGAMPDIRVMMFVVLISTMCPAGTSIPSLACVFDKNKAYASLIVSLTSVLCMVTIPLLVAFAELFIK